MKEETRRNRKEVRYVSEFSFANVRTVALLVIK